MSSLGWISIEITAALLSDVKSGAKLDTFQINVVVVNTLKLRDLAWQLVGAGWKVNMLSTSHIQAYSGKNDEACIDARVSK